MENQTEFVVHLAVIYLVLESLPGIFGNVTKVPPVDPPVLNQSTVSVTPGRPPTGDFTGPWEVGSFPNPQLDVHRCGRNGKASFVCDPDRVLSQNEADRIDKLIVDVTNQTHCMCAPHGECDVRQGGLKIAVAVVRKLKVPKGTDATRSEISDTIVRFGDQLNNHQWNFGYCGDNAVIVLSRNDRKIHTSTGATTKAHIHGECIDQGTHNTNADMNKRLYADAIFKTINFYLHVIEVGTTCQQSRSWVFIATIVGPATAFIIMYLVVRAAVRIRKRKAVEKTKKRENISYRECGRLNQRLSEYHMQCKRTEHYIWDYRIHCGSVGNDERHENRDLGEKQGKGKGDIQGSEQEQGLLGKVFPERATPVHCNFCSTDSSDQCQCKRCSPPREQGECEATVVCDCVCVESIPSRKQSQESIQEECHVLHADGMANQRVLPKLDSSNDKLNEASDKLHHASDAQVNGRTTEVVIECKN